MSNKLLFVTHCDQKNAPVFEKMVKNIYLTGPLKPSLVFMHQSKPYLVAEKTKNKKPIVIIFSEITVADIIAVKDSVTRVLDGKSPRFIHISEKGVINNLEFAASHESVLALLQ